MEGIAVGDRVIVDIGGSGGFAEQVVAPAASVRSLPDGVGFAESTSLMYSTAPATTD